MRSDILVSLLLTSTVVWIAGFTWIVIVAVIRNGPIGLWTLFLPITIGYGVVRNRALLVPLMMMLLGTPLIIAFVGE